MHANQVTYRHYTDPQGCRIVKSHNQLGISRMDRITDKYRNNLILVLESDRFLGNDFNALLKESNLILEASLEPDYGKPIRTHLVGKELLGEYGPADPMIGFTEIKLNPVFRYSVVSSQVMHPGLIKIVLRYKAMRANNNHYKS